MSAGDLVHGFGDTRFRRTIYSIISNQGLHVFFKVTDKSHILCMLVSMLAKIFQFFVDNP